jgi:hypothetical protein
LIPRDARRTGDLRNIRQLAATTDGPERMPALTLVDRFDRRDA